MKLILYLGRHLAATGLAAIAAAALWTVLYAVLLLWALMTGAPAGGPLAYPGLLVFLVLGIMAIGGLVFAPACAAGRLVVLATGWPQLAAMPFVWIAGCLLSHVACRHFLATLTGCPLSPPPPCF